MSQGKLAIWNTNGLQHHLQELKAFIEDKNLDVVLISCVLITHFTKRSYVKIPNYKIYSTNHPAGTARGGSAIIVRESINHNVNENYSTNHIQCTSISTNMCFGLVTFAAIYCPPRYSINTDQYKHFFQSLGNCFVAALQYGVQDWSRRKAECFLKPCKV